MLNACEEISLEVVLHLFSDYSVLFHVCIHAQFSFINVFM